MRSATIRRIALAAAAAGALTLSACSSAGAGDTADGEPEKADLTVAINPSSQFAPFFYGIETGVFEKHGLELEVVPQTDIASIVSGIASGTYDLGFATVVHVVTANANGIPIRAVSSIEGQIKPDDEGTVTIASADSGVTDFAGLDGKRVATVGLSSMNTMTLLELSDEAGGDPESIELVQLPFGQMTAALENGDVDAAVMQWPFASEALESGGEVLGYNNRDIFAGSATTLFNASQQFIDQNPNTIRAFSDAMIESIEASSADPDGARETLVNGLDISPEQAEDSRWNLDSDPRLTVEAFGTAQKLLVKFSDDAATSEAVDLLDPSELVWPGATE